MSSIPFGESQMMLTPEYYRDNFDKLVSHALEWYSDLLSDEEHHWLNGYGSLSAQAQCLIVRLLIRKGDWFRSDKLKYDEIPQLERVAIELEAIGFISINPEISCQELAAILLTKPEIVNLFKNADKKLKKEPLVQSLAPISFVYGHQLAFTVYYLQNAEIIRLLSVLFFANTHQDISQFVMEGLGLHRFEIYQLSKQRRFFQSIQQVQILLELSNIRQKHEELKEKNHSSLLDLADSIPEPINHSYVNRKREQLINRIARDFERVNQQTSALEWYRKTNLPPSRERTVRILEKQNHLHNADLVLTEMLRHPFDLSEREIAHRLKHRIDRKHGIKVPRVVKPVYHSLYLELDISHTRVEIAVKEHFESLGWRVFYLENQFLNGLFGLVFWDIIFSSVDGAFINAYQSAPLDLYHPDFIKNRKGAIEQRVKQIRSGDCQCIDKHFYQKQGITNALVHWGSIDEMLLNLIKQSISHEMLADLFEVMLQDLKLYRSGMPDLIAFKQQEFQWIEVKGPGDSLQESQWRWITQFERLNVPFSVCYVNHDITRKGCLE